MMTALGSALGHGAQWWLRDSAPSIRGRPGVILDRRNEIALVDELALSATRYESPVVLVDATLSPASLLLCFDGSQRLHGLAQSDRVTNDQPLGLQGIGHACFLEGM